MKMRGGSKQACPSFISQSFPTTPIFGMLVGMANFAIMLCGKGK